jgi:hypothetical protein
MYHFYVLKCIAPSQIHRYVLKQQKQTYLDIGICTHRNESGVNYFETLNTSDRCYDFENISTEIFFDSKCSYLISLHNCECILCKNWCSEKDLRVYIDKLFLWSLFSAIFTYFRQNNCLHLNMFLNDYI